MVMPSQTTSCTSATYTQSRSTTALITQPRRLCRVPVSVSSIRMFRRDTRIGPRSSRANESTTYCAQWTIIRNISAVVAFGTSQGAAYNLHMLPLIGTIGNWSPRFAMMRPRSYVAIMSLARSGTGKVSATASFRDIDGGSTSRSWAMAAVLLAQITKPRSTMMQLLTECSRS